MNKEEICLKLIELYYTNISTFRNCSISLKGLANNYNTILEILKEVSE